MTGRCGTASSSLVNASGWLCSFYSDGMLRQGWDRRGMPRKECAVDTTKLFTDKAGWYVKSRPCYPEAYLSYLVERCGLLEGGAVADVGAGTGILTGQLLARGLAVFAVEPNESMRHEAEARFGGCPGFVSVSGTAERTLLEAGSVELVVAAQAFHWFDHERFRVECGRVLRPSGMVGLVWNSRVEEDPFMEENRAICRKYCPNFDGFSGGMARRGNAIEAFFRQGCERRTFDNPLELDREGFIGRNLSASYAPKCADATYGPFVDALSELFDRYAKGGKAVFPNVTRSYLGNV